jgi:hypothetical protein
MNHTETITNYNKTLDIQRLKTALKHKNIKTTYKFLDTHHKHK